MRFRAGSAGEFSRTRKISEQFRGGARYTGPGSHDRCAFSGRSRRTSRLGGRLHGRPGWNSFLGFVASGGIWVCAYGGPRSECPLAESGRLDASDRSGAAGPPAS